MADYLIPLFLRVDAHGYYLSMAGCLYPGCDNPVVALDLCRPHYARRRALSAPPCEKDDCERPSTREGLCSHHYYQRAKATREPNLEPLSYATRRRNTLLPQARALRADGWSFARIGRELGVTGDTISHWLRRP